MLSRPPAEPSPPPGAFLQKHVTPPFLFVKRGLASREAAGVWTCLSSLCPRRAWLVGQVSTKVPCPAIPRPERLERATSPREEPAASASTYLPSGGPSTPRGGSSRQRGDRVGLPGLSGGSRGGARQKLSRRRDSVRASAGRDAGTASGGISKESGGEPAAQLQSTLPDVRRVRLGLQVGL